MNLMEYVGQRIRELRTKHGGGTGISQEALAKELGVTANTISRWETATYRPTLEDLNRLAGFFGASILAFFPREEEPRDEGIAALLRAAKHLGQDDLEELRKYADYRRARGSYERGRGKTRK